MTIRFTLTLTVENGAAGGRAATCAISAAIERTSLTAETLGLTLAEGKAILAELQAAVVTEQVAAHEKAARRSSPVGRIGASRAITRLPAALPSARSSSQPHGCAAADAVLTPAPETVPRSAPLPTRESIRICGVLAPAGAVDVKLAG